IAAGQRLTAIDFALELTGTITGRITDRNGDPMPEVQVQASTYEYRVGQRMLVPGKQVRTNDLGEYRIYWLTPGDYYISAAPSGGGERGGPEGGPRGQRGAPPVQTDDAPSTESYPPSYYPGGNDFLQALTI